MKIIDVQQGTSAWLEVRAGIPTASNFKRIVTPGGKKSDGHDRYLAHLLAERILGHQIDGFKSQYMALGNEYESRAIASYELANECDTYPVGFVLTDDGLLGCSPDRFIRGQPKRMVEAKAPSAPVHVSYLLAATGASKEYKVQLQAELWVCEMDEVDIVSYHPGMPDAQFRTVRDEAFIKEMEAHVRAFSGRLEELAATFKERGWIGQPKEEKDLEYYVKFFGEQAEKAKEALFL